jgi:uncharacterized peroxidase-related enzyme
MTHFPVHTPETAPAGSLAHLSRAERSFGFLPNLIGVMAESPQAAEAYLTLTRIFSEGTLARDHQQIVFLAASAANGCEYCVAAHIAGGLRHGLDRNLLEAVASGFPIAEPKVSTLVAFTRAVVEKRGWVKGPDLEAFLAAGFTRPQALEVIVGVAAKTLSNYVNHVADVPLDEPLKAVARARAA